MLKKIIWGLSNVRGIYRLRCLRKKCNLGVNVELQMDLRVSSPQNLQIGDYAYIGGAAFIQALGNVSIGRGTIIGPGLRIYSANHNFRNATSIPYDEDFDKKPVVIGENVWIGGDVIIVPGTTIGEGVIIGAGSIVTGNILPMSIIGGNPAKTLGKRDSEEYFKLKEEDKIYLKLKRTSKLSKE
jgi:acetyltransferase-like isoleucine patch superfamily enzyme